METCQIDELLDRWHESPSNLAVLSGGFGAGKTHALKAFVSRHSGYNSYQFRAGLQLNTGALAVLDPFDAVNDHAGTLVTSPDLREVSETVGPNSRVVLATRRTRHSSSQLFAQLDSPTRYESLGFLEPCVLELLPWPTEVLQGFDDRGAFEREYGLVLQALTRLAPDESEVLRRPLLFRMLLRIADQLPSLGSGSILPRVYQLYFKQILSAEYDQKNSNIDPVTKGRALENCGYDIFTGATREDSEFVAPLSLGKDRISERILEALEATSSKYLQSRPGSASWTDDFLRTNHVLEEMPTPPLSPNSPRRWTFAHESFYEYWVGAALCTRIGQSIPLGLKADRLSLATVDSLALAFAKALGGAELTAAARRMVVRPHLGVVDRLLLLYLMEEEHDFATVLEATPASYWTELDSVERDASSFFLLKMIRYQRVLNGTYDPYEYVEQVVAKEDGPSRSAEERLLGSGSSVTEQLIQRLMSPGLERALPITVYRLGQMGDQSAIQKLETLQLSRPDRRLTKLCANALRSLRNRLGVT